LDKNLFESKEIPQFQSFIYSTCLEGFENKTLDKTTLTDHSGPEVKEQLLEIWQICYNTDLIRMRMVKARLICKRGGEEPAESF
jgi:hypothetical protein